MRRPVLVPVPVAIISSSRKSVPSKNTTSARAIRSAHRGRHGGGAGNEADARAAGRNLDPDIRAGLARGLRVLAFEIERHLARHREQFGLQAARQARPARRARPPGASPRRAPARRTWDCPRARRACAAVAQTANGSRSRRLSRPVDLIDLGAGQHHGLDRASARSGARMQRLGSPKLLRADQARR